MPDVTVRALKREDLAQAAVLEAEAFPDPWSQKGMEESLMRPETVMLAAVSGEKVVGYVCAYRSADEAEIVKAAVTKEFRNKGVGGELLDGLISGCADKGVTDFVLEVRTDNTEAIRLYESRGFRVLGIRKGFYEKPKGDALIMRMRRDRC